MLKDYLSEQGNDDTVPKREIPFEHNVARFPILVINPLQVKAIDTSLASHLSKYRTPGNSTNGLSPQYEKNGERGLKVLSCFFL